MAGKTKVGKKHSEKRIAAYAKAGPRKRPGSHRATAKELEDIRDGRERAEAKAFLARNGR